MHGNHLYPKKSLSFTSLKPGRAFKEVKCYYVLASYLRFRPSPESCTLDCQHGGRRGRQIKLVKTETGRACDLGWFCAACDVLRAPLIAKGIACGCSSLQTVDLSLKRGGECISGHYTAGKGGVKTNILSREADFLPFSVACAVAAALRWCVVYQRTETLLLMVA